MSEDFTLTGGAAAEQLQAIVERLENLAEEREGINADMRQVRAEAKLAGFDPATITKVIVRRKKSPEDLIEADALVETYEAALGCGAAAAGVLSMERNADGVFEPKMIKGPAAEEKLSRSAQARRSAIDRAELARRAREGV